MKGSGVEKTLQPSAKGEISPLEKHLNAYVERNTRDFFIHKDLKGFLENELDFYLKNEVWMLTDLQAIKENEIRLVAAKAKAIYNISLKIIEFLNQIETFQEAFRETKASI